MIKNILKSKKAVNKYGEEFESNAITLKNDGISVVLNPGETCEGLDFNVNREQALLVEQRFVQKFPSALRYIDTNAEKARIKKERRDKIFASIDKAKDVDSLSKYIEDEDDQEVVKYALNAIKAIEKKAKESKKQKESK